MERTERKRKFVLPVMGLILGISAFSRLTGNENIRAVQMVLLITIGVLLGILLQNLITHFRGHAAA
ncbi:MAG: hypothetical protein ACOH13_13810 [Flavobacteriales bacterium]